MANHSSRQKSTGVRITGGRWRSRRLAVADVAALRPTSDRTRETLFNWLGHNLTGLRAADLFAGSGVLGFEALSRGAASCEFVESHPLAVAALRTAGATFDLQLPECVIKPQTVNHWLDQPGGPFDLVFVDPPFTLGGWPELLNVLPSRLSPQAQIYVEAPNGVAWTWPAEYTLLKETRVGEAALRLFGWAGQP